MAAAASPPVAAHTSQWERAIIAPPAPVAAATIPRYPAPTSGVGPSVPGRSITWIIARAARAAAPTARAIKSEPCADGDGLRRADIRVLLVGRIPRRPGAWGRTATSAHLLTRIVELECSVAGVGVVAVLAARAGSRGGFTARGGKVTPLAGRAEVPD